MKYLDFKTKSLEICMNLDYDNRKLIGDNYEDISDLNYGSPFVNSNIENIDHGTKVSGVIGVFLNALEKEIGNQSVSIMPITIGAIGDPTDKDTALAIRYAVNNGAKIINLSQTKSFSSNDKLVDEAFKYAQEKDVLIIKSAGNEGIDLDKNVRFPNDLDNQGKEIFTNLLTIGAVAKPKLNKKNRFLYKNSNFGKNTVDVFAPGEKIKTLIPGNKYKTSSGTSYAAPITASIAALIRSYYPKLSARQVKQILMISGTSYDVNIPIKQKDGSEMMIPFSELSKSGKVVNAYKALLEAERISN